MRMESEKIVNDHNTRVRYTIHVSYDNSASQLVEYFNRIASENNLEIDDLHFTAKALNGYDGDLNIQLDVSVSRPSTPEELSGYSLMKEKRKQDDKVRAKAEIERLQKILEAE